MAPHLGVPVASPRVYKCVGCRYSFIPTAPLSGCPQCRGHNVLPTVSDGQLIPVRRTLYA